MAVADDWAPVKAAADDDWQPVPPKGIEVPEQIPHAMEARLEAGSEARKREGGLLQTIPQGIEMIATPEGRTRLWEAVKKYPSKFLDDTINMGKLPGDVASGHVDLSTEEGMDQAIGLGMLVAGSRLNKLSQTGKTSGLAVTMGENVSRISKGPMGEIYDLPIGTVARSEDFVTAAQIVAGEDAPMAVQKKMLAAYEEKGLHPSELAHDAQTDPIVAQRLLSSDPADLPPGGIPKETVPEDFSRKSIRSLTADQIRTAEEQQKRSRLLSDPEALREYAADKGISEAEMRSLLEQNYRTNEPYLASLNEYLSSDSAKARSDKEKQGASSVKFKDISDATIADAEAIILDKISVGEAPPKEGWSWDKFYRKAIDDLHPLKAVDEDAYQLARLTRGQFGKAEHFIEHGTFDFETYKTNGKPLAQILEPVAKDLDGLRAYLASKRSLEIEESGRKSGMDVDAATRVAAEGEGKYGKAAAEIVNYQNNLLKYLKDSGVLSEDAYGAMVEAGKNYIPFYRVIGEATGGGEAGKSFGPGTPLKRLKGSERDVIDPLESIIKNTYAYVSIGERNAVGIKLIDALKKEGAEVQVHAPKPSIKAADVTIEGGKAVVKGAPRETYISDIASGKVDLPTVDDLGQAIKAAREGEKKFAEASGFTAEQEARIKVLNRRIDEGGRAADEAIVEKNKILDSVPDEGVDLNIVDVDSLRQLRREFESLEKSSTESIATYEDGVVRVLKRYIVKASEGDDFAKAVFAKALSEARKNGIDTKILSNETINRFLGELSEGDRAFMTEQFRSSSRPKLADETPKTVEPVKPATGPDADLLNYLKENGVTDPEKLVDFIKSAIPEDGDTLGAFRNGVKETVKVNDPELVTAFRGLDQTSADMLTRVLALPAKALRTGATLSPDFIVRNIVRDFMTAFVNSGSALFSPIDTAKGLIGVIRKDADFQNWMKGGGANATMVALDRRYMQESLQKLTQETGLMDRSWNVVKTGGIGPVINGLRMVSELAENATRLGEFKKLVGEGGKENIQSAAFGSREVTLDFARIGASMRAYNMITAFGNAQIQGLDRIGRAFVDRPVNTTLKIAGGITMPSVLLWFANHDDPRYQELPSWQKDLFWIVMTKDHIYRIPKPFELGVVFGSGAERLLDLTIGKNPEAFNNFAKSVMNVITPNFIPTAVQPIAEQFANRSTFSDRTLIPKDMEKHLPEYQYTPYTTEVAKKLGQVISAFPGMRGQATGPGQPFGPIARTMTSPILLENYIRSWSGGLGVYAMQAADAALRKAGVLPDPVTPTPTLADIPVVKAFMVRYPSATTQSIQDFYDKHEETKKYYDTWLAKAKEGDTEAMERIQRAGGPIMFVRLDAIKETLTEHSKLVRDIYKNPTMKAPEKRQLIDSLYYNMIEIGKAGNGMLKASEKALKTATEAAP